MTRIAILGSTGSIGRSTLSIVEAYPERFSVVALAAGANLEVLLQQAQRWHPRLISVAQEETAVRLRAQLEQANLGDIAVASGPEGSVQVATHPEADFVVSAIVGVAGLRPPTKPCGPAKLSAWPTRNLWSWPAN